MDNKIHMQLGHPILIAIYSFSLLSIGAAIGARWGHSPHMAIWMAVLGSGLMVAHDMLTCSIIFFVSTAWALRANRVQQTLAANPHDAVVKPGLSRTLRAASKTKTRPEN